MERRYNNIARYKLIIAGLLLLTFNFYYANISLFLHYHIIDGATIVHSHLCSSEHTQDPSDSSAHSTSELTLFNMIDNYVAESPCEFSTLTDTYVEISTIDTTYDIDIPTPCQIYGEPNRGPPTTTLIG